MLPSNHKQARSGAAPAHLRTFSIVADYHPSLFPSKIAHPLFLHFSSHPRKNTPEFFSFSSRPMSNSFSCFVKLTAFCELLRLFATLAMFVILLKCVILLNCFYIFSAARLRNGVATEVYSTREVFHHHLSLEKIAFTPFDNALRKISFQILEYMVIAMRRTIQAE